MTLPVTDRIAGPYSCNGIVDDFDFAFKVFTTADIRVVKTSAAGVETVLVLDSDYTVVLNADQENDPGGTVTTSTAFVADFIVTIDGALTYGQTAELTNLGTFFPKVIETALDRVVILIQQLKKLMDRSLKFPVSDAIADTELSPAVQRANRVLGFDASGNLTTHAVVTTVYGQIVEQFTATAGQTAFNLANTYVPGINAVVVFQNGLRLRGSGVDYSETSTTVITLVTGAMLGDEIDIVIGQEAASSASLASAVAFLQAGTGAAARDVQAKLRERVSPEDFGATGDGVADDTAELQLAINYAQLTGRILYIKAVHGVSAQLEVTATIGIEFGPGAQLVALDAFPDPAEVDDASWIIHVDGAGCAGSRFVNINLDGNAVAGGLGVFNTSDIDVGGGKIESMRGPGTFLETVSDSEVIGVNYFECGVDPGLDGGGRTSTLRADICDNVKFIGNTVRRSGGKGIAFSTSTDCIASNNYVIDCTDTYGLPYYMAVSARCKFLGNTGIQGFAAGGAGVCKISIDCTYCAVENNTFIECDDYDILVIEDAPNTRVHGNALTAVVATATGRQAIRVDTGGGPTSTDMVVTDNHFYGPGSGVAINYLLATGVFTGNYFNGWLQAISLSAVGGVIHSNTYVDCDVGHLFGGSSSYQPDYIRTLATINNLVATAGSGDFSIGATLAASQIDRTGGVRVKMSGTKTGGAGNKTISFRLGTTDFIFNTAANDTNYWWFEATVLNSLVGGATITQKIALLGFNGATPVQLFGTATENVDAALFIGARINVANAADVVTVQMMTVELLK